MKLFAKLELIWRLTEEMAEIQADTLLLSKTS